jgi:hypothetical chaperone protein
MGARVGIDFGTANSAAALVEGADVRVVPIDPAAEDARLLRSVIFFPAEGAEVLVGGEAIARYLEEIDGRFLQSVKSFLPSGSFDRTEIRRRSYRLEELVAIVLRRMRERVEAAAGPVEHAVFGRPAVFSEDPALEALAEDRLRRAAGLAGWPEPRFVIEPIAAALAYEASLDHDEVVLVGDLGAGTSDFTVMRLGPGRTGDRRGDVLASHGVHVAGDLFDAAIVEHRLLDRFGASASYRPERKLIPLPVWMPRKLLAWHEVILLRERSTMEFLRKARLSADDPAAIGRLIQLVEENLAFALYRSVEAAKRALGAADEALLVFHEGEIDVEERITRSEFEAWTAPLRDRLRAALDRVLRTAGGLEPDAVFLTGGTSKIPSVRGLFTGLFGEGRVREADAFTSVAAGLGRAAV